MNKKFKYIIGGIIFFIISYIGYKIFDIFQLINYAKTNDYVQTHLKEYIITELSSIDLFGILTSFIVVIIYIWNLFLEYIYSKLKTKLQKTMLFILPFIVGFVFYLISSVIIINISNGVVGLALAILMWFVLVICFIFHFIFLIFHLIKNVYNKFKNKKEKEDE